MHGGMEQFGRKKEEASATLLSQRKHWGSGPRCGHRDKNTPSLAEDTGVSLAGR